MSLYNTLFDKNPETAALLGMIKVNMEYFGRFRDVDLIKGGTVIRVFTRTGGNNRADYKENWKKIKKHNLYIKDYDDDFDNTYAYIEFKVPEKFIDTTKKMFIREPLSFEEKFNKELEEMNKPGTPAYERANTIAKKFSDTIDNNGDGIFIIKL